MRPSCFHRKLCCTLFDNSTGGGSIAIIKPDYDYAENVLDNALHSMILTFMRTLTPSKLYFVIIKKGEWFKSLKYFIMTLIVCFFVNVGWSTMCSEPVLYYSGISEL